MQKIINENNMIYIPLTPIMSKDDKGQTIKNYSPSMKGWKQNTFAQCVEFEKNMNTKHSHYLIKCTNDFIIFDTDTNEEYIKLVEILKELNLYFESAITQSTRGNEFKFKRHFWFSVDENEFSEMKKHYFDKMEVFIGSNCNIAEQKISELKNINRLSYIDYMTIKNKFVKEKIEIVKEEIKIVGDDNLIKLINGLHPKRFIDYNFWMRIYWVFINEKLDLNIFKSYSKKHYPAYDEYENNKILNSNPVSNGFKLATLYQYLKEDNYELFKCLQVDRKDFWEMFENIKSHSDPAILYYSMFPNKYIKSHTMGWLEYDNNNIIKIRGEKAPASMLNHITTTFQELLTEQRNLSLPKSPLDVNYKDKMKIFLNAYNKVGTSNYIKGVMDYLVCLYQHDKIDELLDANKDLIAFDNMLYDNKIKDFRPIKAVDYITKTTKYSINLKSDIGIRTRLTTMIKGMFDNTELYNYHLKTISLSLFGNKTESFIINSGKGRNGKGICSNLIEKSFGSYFYSGESTFLTTVYKADRPNSTLYNLRGVRYFLTTEPEADNETKFNIGLIKKITGNDMITTRDLNKSNISYAPQFTPFLQCNTKPKIDNIDDAVKNRFRIIDFPFAFVSNPTKPNEKQCDNNLKDNINQEIYNEFMLLLLDINKNQELIIPKQVLADVDEYLNKNNFVKEWLDNKFDLTDDKKDIIRSKDLLAEYNSSGDYQVLNNVRFAELMKMNNILIRVLHGNKYYHGIKMKEELNDLD